MEAPPHLASQALREQNLQEDQQEDQQDDQQKNQQKIEQKNKPECCHRRHVHSSAIGEHRLLHASS